jgi:hypothetical protein
MKKYQPREEYYRHCGDCPFCYGSTYFFCSHPEVRSLPEKQRAVLYYDKLMGSPTEVWNNSSIPEWCPLEDANEE